MAGEFSELKRRLKRVESIFFRAYCEYVIFNELSKRRAPDQIGQEQSDKNLEVLNSYPSFFGLTIEALRISFLSKTAKLIDTHKDSLHLDSLISFIDGNLGNLTLKEFIKQNSKRSNLSELAKKFTPFTKEDILTLRAKLKGVIDIQKKN